VAAPSAPRRNHQGRPGCHPARPFARSPLGSGEDLLSPFPRDLSDDAHTRGWATYRERFPERAGAYARIYAAIDAGEIVPQPCEICGGEGRPFLDRVWNALVAWKCYRCRKAAAA
jgi:hypothetical protein